MTSLRFLMFTFWNSYVLNLLRLETLTFSDVTLSETNVVLCYVLSQYPLGSFRIFSKIREDIRSSRFATGVNDTGGKWNKPSSRKILIILFGHLWVVEQTHISIFAFKFTLRCLQPDIVAIICHRCQNLPPASLIPVAICHRRR